MLDRVAIIVDEGVVMESQIKDLIDTTKLRSLEQGIQLPSSDQLKEQIEEQLIIQELQLQRGEEFGIRIEDDVLITKNGPEVLTAVAPKQIKDIEKMMSDKYV